MGGGGASGGGGGARSGAVIGPKRVRASMSPKTVDVRERAISGASAPKETVMVASPTEKARIKSYEEITKRQEAAAPLAKAGLTGAALTAIQRATQAKMKTELLKGGTPVVERVGGKDVTVGVVGKGFFGETAYTGRPGFDPIAARAEGKGDVTPAVTPEVTPEVVPDETVLGQAAEAQDKRRRTRYKRAGGAGTMIEGFGALYK